MSIDFEEFLEAGGSPYLERPKNRNPFDPANQTRDPANYFVPIPDRDRVKVPGTMIEAHVERDLREFIERFGDGKYRTMADIARAGYYLFHAEIVKSVGTWDSLNRVKADARIRKLALDLDFAKRDKDVVDRCAKNWRRIEKEYPHRNDLRNEVLVDLRMYGRGIDPYDEGRINAFWDEVKKVPGMAVAAEPVPKIVHEEEGPVEDVVGDLALETVNDAE